MSESAVAAGGVISYVLSCVGHFWDTSYSKTRRLRSSSEHWRAAKSLILLLSGRRFESATTYQQLQSLTKSSSPQTPAFLFPWAKFGPLVPRRWEHSSAIWSNEPRRWSALYVVHSRAQILKSSQLCARRSLALGVAALLRVVPILSWLTLAEASPHRASIPADAAPACPLSWLAFAYTTATLRRPTDDRGSR